MKKYFNIYRFLPGAIIEIDLGRDRYALIDLGDLPAVQKYTWRWAQASPRAKHLFYAEARIDRRYVRLHRFLAGRDCDHKNGDGLDNRRCNLRRATHAQNIANQRKRKNNTSGFKGVSLDQRSGKYFAEITENYQRHFLGYYSTKEEAARAYDRAAIRYFGEFARLNFSISEAGQA